MIENSLRLSAKSSDKLSVRIHRNTRTSKSVVIGYGDITLDGLLGDKEGIDQYSRSYNLRVYYLYS